MGYQKLKPEAKILRLVKHHLEKLYDKVDELD